MFIYKEKEIGNRALSVFLLALISPKWSPQSMN